MRVGARTRTHVHVHTYTYTYTRTRTHVHTYTRHAKNVHTRVCARMHACIRIHTIRMHVHICSLNAPDSSGRAQIIQTINYTFN